LVFSNLSNDSNFISGQVCPMMGLPSVEHPLRGIAEEFSKSTIGCNEEL
jgi:hypothetical protein